MPLTSVHDWHGPKTHPGEIGKLSDLYRDDQDERLERRAPFPVVHTLLGTRMSYAAVADADAGEEWDELLGDDPERVYSIGAAGTPDGCPETCHSGSGLERRSQGAVVADEPPQND